MSRYFVYGSLMNGAVLKALIGRVPASRPAVLPAFRRVPLVGRAYPACVADDARSCTPGRVLYDISEREERVFDWFEADEYEKVVVEVRVGQEGPHKAAVAEQARAYIWPRDGPHKALLLLDEEWSYAEFETKHLAQYLVNCKEWMAGFEDDPASGDLVHVSNADSLGIHSSGNGYYSNIDNDSDGDGDRDGAVESTLSETGDKSQQ